MFFGFGAHPAFDERAAWLRAVARTDRDGLDLFSLADHPYLGDRLDAYATLGFALGRTERIAGLVNVTNPARRPTLLARTVSSLLALSGNRFVLGMGAGGRWERIAELGLPRLAPGEAVAAFEEAIRLVREMVGEAAPPIWTGSVGPRSLRVTGRLADGWIPGHAADWVSSRYRASRPVIDAAAAAAGRDPFAVRTVFNLPGRITTTPLEETRDADGRWVGGSAAQWIEELSRAVRESGAYGFLLFSPTGGTADDRSLGIWANEIAPAVRNLAGPRVAPDPAAR